MNVQTQAAAFPEIRVPAGLTFAGLALGFALGVVLHGTPLLDRILTIAYPTLDLVLLIPLVLLLRIALRLRGSEAVALEVAPAEGHPGAGEVQQRLEQVSGVSRVMVVPAKTGTRPSSESDAAGSNRPLGAPLTCAHVTTLR